MGLHGFGDYIANGSLGAQQTFEKEEKAVNMHVFYIPITTPLTLTKKSEI